LHRAVRLLLVRQRGDEERAHLAGAGRPLLGFLAERAGDQLGERGGQSGAISRSGAAMACRWPSRVATTELAAKGVRPAIIS
jgi:hypothetical protein